MTFAKRLKKRRRRKLAQVGEYRTITPKKGVYIRIRKKKTGKMGAERLRRTKERVRRTGKKAVERI